MKKQTTHCALVGLLICLSGLTLAIGHGCSLAPKEILALVNRFRFTEMVPMQDGTLLATDVTLPNETGRYPVLLVRTPYGKDSVKDTDHLFLLQSGVGLIVQDTRGRFDSEGTDCIFRCDHEDGQTTLDWITSQPWSDGQVVMQGGSATGIVQYMLAPSAPDGLRALHASVATPSLCEHGIYQNGVFRKALAENWLEDQNSLFFLEEAEAHPDCDDPYWDASRMDARFDEVNVPAVHITGWYDIFCQGNIDAFVGYHNDGGPNAVGQQKLVIGPWDHSMSTTYPLDTGEYYTFPDAEDPPQPPSSAHWFLHYLGIDPIPEVVAAVPAVQYYVMGDVEDPSAPGNEWRWADNWPIPFTPRRFYLQPGGGLSEDLPPADGAFSSYAYDPANPCPTLGGANMTIEFGPEDQRPIEAREDVLVFETPVLTEPLEFVGRVWARIYAAADTLDTDIMVRLTDVYPDGKSVLIMDGPARLSQSGPYTPGSIVAVDVDLWSTAVALTPGHRLRISVTSSNYPRFRANPNDGSVYGEPAESIIANVQIHHAADAASYIELPIPTEKKAM